MDGTSIIDALILGVIEGLTEFIPVSSTAHILLAGRALGFENPGKMFEVLIQLGAILAILAVYAGRLIQLVRTLPSDPKSRRFVAAVFLAFLPAAVLGTMPQVRDELAADRSLIPQALEEMLRYFGIVHAVPRMVCEEGMEVAGVQVPAGSHIMALIGAAGRDPARYEDPDTFDIHREQKPHLAFGFGMHTCLGAILARMETLQATQALLDRMPSYRFAEPVTYDSFMLRGPRKLVIERTD